ncbi:hypothetical protein [Flavobacterium sp. T12S277]|uniref:hypothetical protein n=1 Tax=Flavobacterium sp. T12S277 TaxID=3402752 RepID=UPI003AE72683
MNITGNIVSGQITGDTTKQLSDRFGKIIQDRESLSITSADTSISRSKQLESAIPVSKISSLSSGEFVGMVADDPDCKIKLKIFHSEIINDHQALKKEQDNYKDIPIIRKVDNTMVKRNYLQIKQDVEDIIHSEMDRLFHDPKLVYFIIKKSKKQLNKFKNIEMILQEPPLLREIHPEIITIFTYQKKYKSN